VETVWRREAARVIASLARITRDVGVAEDLAQDALLAAIRTWPESGVPDNPGAWLVTTGKRLAIDQHRRQRMIASKEDELALGTPGVVESSTVDALVDDALGDDVLRLAYVACHPVLSMDARVALTLRLLCGLSTDEIARAFLVPSTTIGQRIVRAKRTLADAGVPFELPRGDELAPRTASVLRVVYLVFNEGYSATSSDDLIRADFCAEAIRLGRLLVGLMPDETEVSGLLALMELQSSRAAARVDAEGRPKLLLEQDRSLWDKGAIHRGLGLLVRAQLRGGRGPYVLQAEFAACHARASRAEDTDWRRIAARYGELARLTPSSVIELNRAIAVSMAEGPAAGLAILDALVADPVLARYHLLPAARGDLLEKLGRVAEAKTEFERAAANATHPRERELMNERAARCGGGAATNR
jgi:RNA polymerase sigma factor (sigma-70 family)